jgi:hypothetical protein
MIPAFTEFHQPLTLDDIMPHPMLETYAKGVGKDFAPE